MKKKSFLNLLLILILSSLVACNASSQEPTVINENEVATVVAATLSALPTPTSQLAPTDIPVPTQTSFPPTITPEPLDRTNIQSVLNWVSYAFSENMPEMISDLIDENGAEFGARYASSVAFPGFNNSEQIVSELQKGLQTANTTCMGYSVILNARPDKANIYFSGFKFEWDTDIIGFIFFYQNEGWELVAIAPIPQDQTWSNLYETLWACQ